MSEKKKVTIGAAATGDNYGIKPEDSDDWFNLSDFVDDAKKQELQQRQSNLGRGDTVVLQVSDGFYSDISMPEESGDKDASGGVAGKQLRIRKQVALKAAVEHNKAVETDINEENVLRIAEEFDRWLGQ